MLASWAYEQHEKSSYTYITLLFSQILIFLQLILTFFLQIPYHTQIVSTSPYAMVCDMFGLLLHNIETYNVTFCLIMKFRLYYI